jgi:hypothetical protein
VASRPGIDLVLGHVHRTRILDDATQRRVAVRIASAGLHGNGDVLADLGELFRHAIPAREHRVLANFKYAAHEPFRLPSR